MHGIKRDLEQVEEIADVCPYLITEFYWHQDVHSRDNVFRDPGMPRNLVEPGVKKLRARGNWLSYLHKL